MSDETEPKPPEPAEGGTEAPEPAAESPQMTVESAPSESPAAEESATPTAEPASAEAPSAADLGAVTPTGPTPDELSTLRRRPTYVFFGVLAGVSLLADILTKAWAEVVLSKRTALDPGITLVKDHLSFTLAYNKGGAWGLLHDASENVRRPFFLLVSVLAIAFIVSLYSRLAPSQRALKWGLPLVLGGALGNLSDRITRSSVIDFIDYRADWIEKMNHFIAKYAKGWAITDHWPTFNVADVFICIGVALMAVDMATSRRKPPGAPATPAKEIEPQPKIEAPPAAVPSDPPPEAPPATG